MTQTTTNEHPILFGGPMVRAILEGRKTQTRRICKGMYPDKSKFPVFHGDRAKQNNNGTWDFWSTTSKTAFLRNVPLDCPYGVPGDRLWVREGVLPVGRHPDPGPCAPRGYFYRADCFESEIDQLARDAGERWKPSIHRPRWASRITLEVKRVWVERVQEISAHDALAEGIECVVRSTEPEYGVPGLPPKFRDYSGRKKSCIPRDSFMTLWDSINASKGYGWDSNPWVWCVEFERVEDDR